MHWWKSFTITSNGNRFNAGRLGEFSRSMLGATDKEQIKGRRSADPQHFISQTMLFNPVQQIGTLLFRVCQEQLIFV